MSTRGPIPKLLAYGLASFVSYSRIRAKQHFPSDVFIGSTMGPNGLRRTCTAATTTRVWAAGNGDRFGIFCGWKIRHQRVKARRMYRWIAGSTTPWIVLAGLGLVDSGFAGLRPWTRGGVFAIGERGRRIGRGISHDDSSEAGRLIEALQVSLNRPGRGRVRGVPQWSRCYSRMEQISRPSPHQWLHFRPNAD